MSKVKQFKTISTKINNCSTDLKKPIKCLSRVLLRWDEAKCSGNSYSCISLSVDFDIQGNIGNQWQTNSVNIMNAKLKLFLFGLVLVIAFLVWLLFPFLSVLLPGRLPFFFSHCCLANSRSDQCCKKTRHGKSLRYFVIHPRSKLSSTERM